jgi:hypothetical protein
MSFSDGFWCSDADLDSAGVEYHGAMVYLETIGAACRRVFAEILRFFIQAVLEMGRCVKDLGKSGGCFPQRGSSSGG